ncbi:Lar family restriction alleviation protein [Stenotrophomonas acidaminiphila]|jgi:Lar family restriction alleviation protein
MADLMQQARELLPCPFCGGEATLRMIGNVHSTRKCVVKCSGCRYERTDAVLRYGDEWLLKTAIAAWNRRSAMRAAPEGFVLVPVERGQLYVCPTCHGPGVVTKAVHDATRAARPQGVKE